MKFYHYLPFKSSTDIRIFALEPAEGETPLRGRIVDFTLEDVKSGTVQYEAISYVWGKASDKVTLDCCDGHVEIPRNLSVALRYMRRRDQTRYIWADSISINQKDAPEKSHEVGRMYDIFSLAKGVVMWLGEKTPDTAHSLSSLRVLCEAVCADPEDDRYKKIVETMKYASQRGKIFTKDPILMASKDPSWPSLGALFSLPYFSRLWVLQEAIAPRLAILKLGDDELDWQIVRKAAPLLGSKFWDLRRVFPAVTDYMDIDHNLHNFFLMGLGIKSSNILHFQPSERSNLLSVLLCTSTLATTEPVDALFAILHLAAGISPNSEEDHELLPDYDASTGQIFQRLAIWLIVKHGQYDYLAFARAYMGEYPERTFFKGERKMKEYQALLRTSETSSWVPLRLNPYMDISYYYHLTAAGSKSRRVRPAKAGGDSSTLQMPTLSADQRILGLLGKFVDRVHLLSTRPISDFLEKISSPLLYDSKVALSENIAEYLTVSLREVCGENWMNVFESEAMFHLIQYTTILTTSKVNKPMHTIDDLSEEEKSRYGARYVQYLQEISRIASDPSRTASLEFDWDFESVNRSIIRLALRSKFCWTQAGRLGLVPWHTRETDLICILNQVCVPLVIRPDDNGHSFTVVGECFVDSIMNGEALNFETTPTETIHLS